MFCPACGGSGSVPCPTCVCLDCGGVGSHDCPGCDQGRLACRGCEGTGQTRSLLVKRPCAQCKGTGQELHADCDGTGTVACSACAGLGHQPGCSACGSTGEQVCFSCFGSGLAASPTMIEHAASGSFPALLKQLPIVDEVAPGELLDHSAAVRRILAFLAAAHWNVPAESDESEHELNVLRNRIHIRAAFLLVGTGSAITVDYRFLTVQRTGEDGYRLHFEAHRKAWK